MHLAGLLVLGDFTHGQTAGFGTVGEFDPASVEDLTSAGGIEGGAVEGDGGASVRRS